MIRQRVRIRFRKEGDLRLISHRDLLRVFERMFRRAELRLSMSEGFHPKARMSFPSALSLGIRGTDELMEFELSEEVERESLLAKLQSVAPPGLSVTRLQLLAAGEGKGQVERFTYEIPVPRERWEQVQAAVERLLSATTWLVERPSRKEPVDLIASLDDVEIADGVLRFRLKAARSASARPREVLEALGLSDLEHDGQFLTRTRVEIGS